MKKILTLLVFSLLASGAFAEDVDPFLAREATAVLRVKCAREKLACGADCWQTAEIQEVIKNEGTAEFEETVKVAHREYKKGIPIGTSTIYLVQYKPLRHDLWKLLGGEADFGVSHHQE